ncbi:hypothetical protein [Mesorhizobium sp. M0898]
MEPEEARKAFLAAAEETIC